MLTRLAYVVLPVHDIEESVHFYTQYLGFEQVPVKDGPGPYWTEMRLPQGDARIGLIHQPKASPSSSPVLLFSTDDLHETCATLERLNVTFVQPPQFIERGTAIIKDPSGNQLVLTSVE